jgi:hypothetical protein
MKISKKLALIFIISLAIFNLFNLRNEYSEATQGLKKGSLDSNFETEFLDEIEPGCNLLENIKYDKRDNFDISLTIPDSKKWNSRLIKGELKDGARIAETYKKQQYAFFTFKDKKSEKICIIESKIRISGDAADHINIDKMIASLDVELLNDNLFGFTDFKLFLPESRHFENEIFVTSLLSELGYLAPTSFFIEIDVNGKNAKYIFQEKINKIFIESQNFKEGPILESYEQIAWGERDWFTPNTLVPPKVNNKTWLRKSVYNQDFAKFAIEKVHKLRIYAADIYGGDMVLNYESLNTVNANYLKEYQLMLTVLRAHHGLSFSDRKFYIDPTTEFLHPIYYDGTPTLLENQDGNLVLNPSELGERQFEKKVPVLNLSQENIENLTSKLKNLNYKDFLETLKKKGVEKNILLFNENEFKEYLIEDVETYSSELNLTNIQNLESYFNSNQEKIEQFMLLFEEKDNYEICEMNLVTCEDFILPEDSLVDILSGDFHYEDKIVIFIGNKNSLKINSDKKFINYKVYKNDQMNYSVYFIEDAKFKYEKNILTIENPTPGFRALINSEKLINEKIIFTSNLKNIQYSPTLLTGCINIVNSVLVNFDFQSKFSGCEDSLNIINSSGSINSMYIENTKYDGLDLDFSNIKINLLEVNNAGNDCSDFSYGNYEIQKALLTNCDDKGISIGEKSIFNSEEIETTFSNIGIATKDSAIANIKKFKSENNVYCIASYRKKQEFGKPDVKIDELICSSKNIYNQ